jgi:hypothetical protein
MRKRLSTCKWCSSPIRWALTPKGHHLAIDPHPVTDGNLRMTVDDRGYPHVWVLRKDDPRPLGAPLFIAHMVTCPSPQATRARNRYTRTRGQLGAPQQEQLPIPPGDGW